MDAFPWPQRRILMGVEGDAPMASPAVVVIHTGAGRFRLRCRPPRAIDAPVRSRDVVIVRRVSPGGILLVERCRPWASNSCWFAFGDVMPVPGDA